MSKKKENHVRDIIIAVIVIGGLVWGCFAVSEKVGFVHMKVMERLAETYCNHHPRKAENMQNNIVESPYRNFDLTIQETDLGMDFYTDDLGIAFCIIRHAKNTGFITKDIGDGGVSIDMSNIPEDEREEQISILILFAFLEAQSSK